MNDLSLQPAPKRGAKPGFYPDPLRTGRARWWDGDAWTLRMGPPVGSDADPKKPVPPPKKICRHCGAEAETFQERCPNCGKSYTSNRALIIGLVAAAVLGLALIAGCAALVGETIRAIDDDLEEEAITQAEFEAVKQGETQLAIESRLGRPDVERDFDDPSEPEGASCLYYEIEGETFTENYFQLCFAGGVLVSKRAY